MSNIAVSYLESTETVAAGSNSIPCCWLPISRSHSSSWVSLEKSASTAPALVPVTIEGAVALGDHAKTAVREISRIRTILKSLEGTVEDYREEIMYMVLDSWQVGKLLDVIWDREFQQVASWRDTLTRDSL